MLFSWTVSSTSAGPIIAVASVFLGALGIPIPTFAALIFVGSLIAARGPLDFYAVAVFAAAMLGAVVGDVIWFSAGRKYGGRVLHLICRLSLSRDTCVRRTAELFAKRGVELLLVSRFIPGLSVVSSPLSGASGVPLARFIAYAETGAALWIVTGLAIGFFFADNIGATLLLLEHFGMDVGGAAAALIAIYVAVSWFRRHQLLRQLRMARITVDELAAMMATGSAPAIIDARPTFQHDADPFVIPGAKILGRCELAGHVQHIPRPQSVVVYCSCPNEISAAVVAKKMHRLGFTNVRPLAGGLEAWRDQGHWVQPIEHVPADIVAEPDLLPATV